MTEWTVYEWGLIIFSGGCLVGAVAIAGYAITGAMQEMDMCRDEMRRFHKEIQEYRNTRDRL